MLDNPLDVTQAQLQAYLNALKEYLVSITVLYMNQINIEIKI